jgi:hypothetical protein
MANSIRQQIMVAVVSSLTNVSTDNGYQTDVKFVSENMKHFSELDNNKFPALFPIDTDEAKEAFTFRESATAQDMKSTLTVLVTSYLFSRTGVTVQARSDLLRDIEKAMMNATAMTTISNVIDIRPMKVTTDQGTIENYSVHDQEFQIDYTYNHADGG